MGETGQMVHANYKIRLAGVLTPHSGHKSSTVCHRLPVRVFIAQFHRNVACREKGSIAVTKLPNGPEHVAKAERVNWSAGSGRSVFLPPLPCAR